jgi:superfamily II DNA or RNA helicase
MNLDFQHFQDIERDGVMYDLQKADITRCGEFWRFWRTSAADPLKLFMYIRPENGGWFVYRLKNKQEKDGRISYGEFNLRYQVQNQSRLLPYQPAAVSHLVQSIIDNGAAADGSDTGIGKTYQALAVCRELALRPFIVCRKAGFPGWKKGCRYMDISPLAIINWELLRTAKVALKRDDGTSYSVLTRKKRAYKAGYDYSWTLPNGTLLIFDEAHLGFNEESQNYALWTASAGRASLSLSATFADRPSRVKGLFQVLHVMGPETFDKWLLEQGHFTNQYNDLESMTALADMKGINKILYPKYGYRVSYEDPAVKAYFPERVIQTEVVDIGLNLVMEQNKAYDEMLIKAAKLKQMGKQAELLVADLRYRQHAELLKVKALVEMTEEYLYEGMSVVVFVNFRETLRYLAEMLHTKSLIFGNQEQYKINRETVMEDFQANRERMILCMVDAGGQSLDLHDLEGGHRRISLICPTYNPVALQQVLGRTYRAGSKSIPIMKLVYAAGTVEEKVAETVNKKLDNIAALNDGDLMEPDLFQLGAKNES